MWVASGSYLYTHLRSNPSLIQCIWNLLEGPKFCYLGERTNQKNGCIKETSQQAKRTSSQATASKLYFLPFSFHSLICLFWPVLFGLCFGSWENVRKTREISGKFYFSHALVFAILGFPVIGFNLHVLQNG